MSIGLDNTSYIIRLYLLCDVSGSMHGVRLIALNRALNHALTHIQRSVQSRKVRVYVNALCYSTYAKWYCNDVLLEQCYWQPIEQAQGISQLGQAFKLLASRFKTLADSPFDSTNIVLLFTDGKPTDAYQSSLQQLLQTRIGQNTIRLGFGLGSDTDLECLQAFQGTSVVPVFTRLAPFKHQLTHSLEHALQLGYLRALKSLRLSI